MTNEEAIKQLKKCKSFHNGSYGTAINLAIKALEQQPCEDCISRQAIKEMLSEEWIKYMPMQLDMNLSFVLEKISELPSVTPKGVTITDFADRCRECGKQKAGKWKRISPAGIYECTNCNQVIMTSDIDCYKYCHGCGVRMEGEE